MTMTFASSVTVWPVAPTRHVTLRALRSPCTVSVPMLVTNASAMSVTALPCFDHRSAVSAIGT
jgi:hypothetical protein